MKRLVILIFFLFSPLLAQIKYVPTDYEIIQDAINDSNDGDVIIVKEGTYHQQIDFKGKAITVASEYYLDGDTEHISRTIIDGSHLGNSGNASLVYFMNGEDSNSVLSGFTLQNGRGFKVRYADYGLISEYEYSNVGGAVVLVNSGGTVTNNIVQNNMSSRFGNSGVPLFFGYPASGGGLFSWKIPENNCLVVKNNEFRNNSVEGVWAMGGAVHVELPYGKLLISKNIFIENRAKARDSGYGGSIAVLGLGESDVIIENNFITKNSIHAGFARGGGVMFRNINGVIRNNIIADNIVKIFNTGNWKTARGGGIAVERLGFTDPFKATIENNTIVNNTSPQDEAGGGISSNSCTIEIVNSIVRDNSPSHNQINLKKTTSQSYVNFTNVQGGYEGEGNIDLQPSFNDEVYYCLKPNESKCIDAGHPADKYNDVKDPEGNIPKPPAYGTLRNDIGAFGGPHSQWGDMGILTDIRKSEIMDIPNRTYLSQNYPNPFNPSTTIIYSLPGSTEYHSVQRDVRRETMNGFIPSGVEGCKVILKVYDVLGREVTTLVNKNQKPGSYEVTWSAGDYPSGIYFYKLSTGDFTNIRKMVLIK